MNAVSIITGDSGTGKTTSCRNLGRDTVLLNVERKALPFKPKGIINQSVENMEELYRNLDRLTVTEKVKTVVIDSFSDISDMVYAACKQRYKGFDIFSNYNSIIYDLFQRIKRLKVDYVFVIAHNELLMDSNGRPIRRVKVRGKEFEGFLERYATCLFCAIPFIDDTSKKVQYKFLCQTDGSYSAKTPMDMFGTDWIDNDLAQIVEVYDDFYKDSTITLTEAAPTLLPQESGN